MRSARRVTLAVLLVVAFAVPTVSAAVPSHGTSPWTTDRTVVKNIPPDDTSRIYAFGSLSDDHLAYQMSASGASQVLLCDLRTEATSTINDGLERQSYPSIGGENVLYAGYDGEDWGLYRYWLADNESELVTQTGSAPRADIDGDTGMFCFDSGRALGSIGSENGVGPTAKGALIGGRVWVGDVGDLTDIRPLAPTSTYQYGGHISGDYVAYVEYVDTRETYDLFDVKVQSISDPDDSFTVADDVIAGPELDFSGDIVAWQEWDAINSVYKIQAYDLSAGQATTVYQNSEWTAYNPTVAGTKVYFVATEPPSLSGATSLAVYDMVSQMYVEPPAGLDQQLLAADGDKFVWSNDNLNTDSEIVMSTLGQPRVFVNTDDYVDYDEMPFVSGWIEDGGTGVGDGDVALQISPDGQLWETVDTATSDGDGDFFLNAPKLKTYAYYRVVYMGEASPFFGDVLGMPTRSYPLHLSAASHAVDVVARAQVGIASAPSNLKKDQHFTSRGLIAPTQNRNVQAAGRIECYRKVNGQWKFVKSYSTAFTNGGYWAQMKFTTRGAWRYRMHFLGSNTNAPDYGPWRGVTVK